jgi:hypothetical protein
LARFGEHATWFAFTSGRFDRSSQLPAEANAGNRFYGRDVAELIGAGLADRGLEASFIDEDWGWQTHGKRPDGSVLEISIYHNIEEDASREDDWTLMVRLLRKERVLALASRFREVAVDADAVSALTDVFANAGIALARTSAPQA